jgi:transposase-like protein
MYTRLSQRKTRKRLPTSFSQVGGNATAEVNAVVNIYFGRYFLFYNDAYYVKEEEC